MSDPHFVPETRPLYVVTLPLEIGMERRDIVIGWLLHNIGADEELVRVACITPNGELFADEIVRYELS